jgi:hypothetical protein
MSEPRKPLLCPSAQPDMAGSMAIGVVGGTAENPRLAWIEKPQPVTEDLLRLARPAQPTEVFRFAAHCEENACSHFDGAKCKLATRIVQILPAVSGALPPCQIRGECRWFQQEGRPACMRCPQIVTQSANAGADMVLAATPA